MMETPHHVDKIMGAWVYIKECWRGVVTIVTVIAIAGSLTAFWSSLVFQSELDAAEVRMQKRYEVSEERMQKSFELRDNVVRLNSVNESITRIKVFLATVGEKHPHYKNMIEELQELKLEKEKLQKQMEKK